MTIILMNENNSTYLNAMGIQTWQLKNRNPIASDINTDLMILGEISNAPSEQLFAAMLNAIGFERNTVYVSSLVPSLEEQFTQMKPKVLLVLGPMLACRLLKKELSFDQLRGKI